MYEMIGFGAMIVKAKKIPEKNRDLNNLAQLYFAGGVVAGIGVVVVSAGIVSGAGTAVVSISVVVVSVALSSTVASLFLQETISPEARAIANRNALN